MNLRKTARKRGSDDQDWDVEGEGRGRRTAVEGKLFWGLPVDHGDEGS